MIYTRHLCDSQVAAQAGAQDVVAQAGAQDVAAQEDAQEDAPAAMVADGTALQPTSDISAQTALGALAKVLHVEGVSPRASVMVAEAQALATQAVAVQSTVVDHAAAQDVAAQVDVAYVDGDVAQAASTATDGMPPKALQRYSQVVAQATRAAQVSPREVWNVEGVSL